MGSVFSFPSKIVSDIEKKQKDAAIKQQLIQLKINKRKRDIMVSTRIATIRDRVYWMAAFYCTMGAVSLARIYRLKEISPLPLRIIPYIREYIFALY
jgi:hypothetical protein